MQLIPKRRIESLRKEHKIKINKEAVEEIGFFCQKLVEEIIMIASKKALYSGRKMINKKDIKSAVSEIKSQPPIYSNL